MSIIERLLLYTSFGMIGFACFWGIQTGNYLIPVGFAIGIGSHYLTTQE